MEPQTEKKRPSQLLDPGLVISKKSYVFDAKKQFSNVRKYKVSYTDELSIGNILAILREAIAPKEKGKKKRVRPPLNKKAILFSALKYVLFFLILLGLGFMLLLYMFSSQPVPKPLAPNQSVNYTYEFVSTEVISFKSDLKAYATIRFNGTYVNSSHITMRLYERKIPRDIVMLKSRKYEDDNFGDFNANLKSMLQESGLDLNEMRISQLMHMPDNTSMIIIAPTGKVPLAFLGLDDPNFSIKKLMDNGVVIIYIGSSFESGAIAEDGSPYSNVSSALKRLDIEFEPLKNQHLEDGFKMIRPSWQISNGRVVHGGISILDGTQGYLVYFPNTLKFGWTSGAEAASDIYSAIRNVTWLKPSSQSDPFTIGNADKSKRLESTYTIFSAPYTQRTNLTAQFLINVVDFNNNSVTKIEYVPFPLVAKGTINHDDRILPTDICVKEDEKGNVINCQLYMTIDLNETTERTELMKIVSYKDDVKIDEVSIDKKSTRLKDEKWPYTVKLPHGDYILKIEDDTGYVYAQSFIHVQGVELASYSLKYLTGNFYFEVFIDSESLAANKKTGNKVEVKNIAVSLDGQQPKNLSSSDGLIHYVFSGAVPEGSHEFQISVGEESQTIKDSFIRRRDWWENPIYQGLLLVALIFFVVAFFIKRPESVIFQLDVPDFPPLSKTKVPISREQACQIFELVNTDYRWTYMPLKHGEIKNGFRKLSYKGRPILVSDYNLERILDQLMEEGLVLRSTEFYGLASWEKKSGKPLDYLAIFRSLRDSFLNMSVHFSDFGDRTDCDIQVSAQERYYVHIYRGPETIERVLSTLNKGKTLLVFKDMDSRDSFVKSLSSTNKALILVKLYIDRENLLIGTPVDMEKIIK